MAQPRSGEQTDPKSVDIDKRLAENKVKLPPACRVFAECRATSMQNKSRQQHSTALRVLHQQRQHSKKTAGNTIDRRPHQTLCPSPPLQLLHLTPIVRDAGFWPMVRKRLRKSSTPKFVIADPKNMGLCSPVRTRSMSRGSTRLGGAKNTQQQQKKQNAAVREQFSSKSWTKSL